MTIEIDDEEQIRKNIDLALQDEYDLYYNMNPCSSNDDNDSQNGHNGFLDRLFGNDDDDDKDNHLNLSSDHRNNSIENNEQLKGQNIIETNFSIHNKYHFSLIQSDTAFDNSGSDTTGSVLWGASISLAHYILTTNDLFYHYYQHVDKYSTTLSSTSTSSTTTTNNVIRIIELGCGSCALPSIAIAKRWMYDTNCSLLQPNHQMQIVTTDNNHSSLQRVQSNIIRNIIEMNKTNEENNNNIRSPSSSPHIEVKYYDWHQEKEKQQQQNSNNTNNDSNNDNVYDILLAADVIYGVSSVPALVRTINGLYNHTNHSTRIYIATKDGRRGIKEFRYYIKQYITELYEIDTISYTSNQLSSNDKEFGCQITTLLHNENKSHVIDNDLNASLQKTSLLPIVSSSSSSRWNEGSYTIYVYGTRPTDRIEKSLIT